MDTLSTHTRYKKTKEFHTQLLHYFSQRVLNPTDFDMISMPGPRILEIPGLGSNLRSKMGMESSGGRLPHIPPSVPERRVQGASQYWCARDPCASTECDNQGWVCGIRSPAGPMPILLSTNWNPSRDNAGCLGREQDCLKPAETGECVRARTYVVIQFGDEAKEGRRSDRRNSANSL